MLGTIFRYTVVIAAYWAVAIAMVFVTKRLMTSAEIQSEIFVLLVWLQNIIAIVSIVIMYVCCQVVSSPWMGPVLRLDLLLIPDMIYASMTFTSTIIFNNLMLKYISLVFYQVARSLTLIFVITFSSLFLNEKITTSIMLSCLFIITGFYITVDVERISQGLQVNGIIYGVLASAMAAVCGVFFKRVQKFHQMDTMQLALNNNILSFVVMTPLVISSGELHDFFSSSAASSKTVWSLFFLSGFISLFMGWITAIQISVTSPLTHNISINAKSVFMTLMAIAWSGESRSGKWWLGNLFVMLGIATYTTNKLKLMNRDSSYEKYYPPPSKTEESENVCKKDDKSSKE